jgi:hypothetical protein
MGSGGNTSIGGFLSMSPEMRHDVSQVDTRFDPHMMDLRAEQGRYQRGPLQQFNQGQLDTSTSRAALLDQLHLPETYAAAARNVDALASAANRAADALDRIARNGGGSSPSGRAQAPGGAPRNPQAGGVGAGAGFVDSRPMASIGPYDGDVE